MNYEGPDTISAELLKALEGHVTNYSALQGKLAAAEGDRDAAVQAFMENSDDTQAVKLRNAIKAAEARLRELAEKSVVSETLPEDEKEKLRTELKTLSMKVKEGFNAVKSVANSLGKDPEGVLKALGEIQNPTHSGRGRRPGTAGSTLPRVSVDVMLMSSEDPPKKVEFDNMAKAAIYLGFDDAKELQLAFADAAGVKHEDIKTVKRPIEFKLPATESGIVWTVKTEPKERNKPGPRKAAA